MVTEEKDLFWTKTKIILIILCLLAIFFFWFSYTLIKTNVEGGHIMRDASLAIFATTFVAFIYETILRYEYMRMIRKLTERLTIDFNSSVDKKIKELLERFSKVIDEKINYEFRRSFDDIEKKIEQSLKSEREDYIKITKEKLDETIESKMPGHYRRIREHGIVDVYKSINNDPECKILTEIFSTQDATVRVNAIWASYIETAKRTSYIHAIEKLNTNFNFLLLDPENKEAIRKRADTLPGYNEGDVIKKINENIFEIRRVFQAVHNKSPDLAKSHIKLRLHSSFITTPLIAINERFLLGFYFSGRPSFEGAQIKIVNSGKYLYNEILQHWNSQWNNAKEIDLLKE